MEWNSTSSLLPQNVSIIFYHELNNSIISSKLTIITLKIIIWSGIPVCSWFRF